MKQAFWLYSRAETLMARRLQGKRATLKGADAPEDLDMNLRWLTTLVAAFFLIPLIAAGSASADEGKSKKLFVGKKCNACHTIEAKGIEQAKDEEEEDDDGDVSDLSKVGTKHDAAWIAKFLDRKEKLDGKNHKKRFKGTEADRQAIADWLGTLK